MTGGRIGPDAGWCGLLRSIAAPKSGAEFAFGTNQPHWRCVAFPVPGKWSVQQLVMHMLDSDLVAGERMKRIIAEPRP